jgi:hypothetical protein
LILIKVDDEDEALILLGSPSDVFDNFVNSMLYGRDTISLADVKSVDHIASGIDRHNPSL